MPDTRIVLSGLWIAVMLTYLLGDVLRICAGDVVPGELAGTVATPGMWLLVAVIMLVPIVMLVLSLTLPLPAIRTVSLVAAVGSILFNLLGLPYPGAYDTFLIVVSMILCGVIGWYAWNWT
jgi:hypothetical protein